MSDLDVIIDRAFRLNRFIRHRMHSLKDSEQVNIMQLHVLAWIAEHEGVTMKELAEFLRISSPSATVFVQRLVKLGLVKRSSDRTNRRLVRLSITPKAARFWKKKMREGHKTVRNIFKLLPAADQRSLARILGRLTDSLERSHTSHGTR